MNLPITRHHPMLKVMKKRLMKKRYHCQRGKKSLLNYKKLRQNLAHKSKHAETEKL